MEVMEVPDADSQEVVVVVPPEVDADVIVDSPEGEPAEMEALEVAGGETNLIRGIGIMPFVVWDIIVDNAPSEVGYSLSRSCKDLWKLVKTDRPGYLPSSMAIREVVRYLGREDTLNARASCELWNRFVDMALEHGPLNQTPDSNNSNEASSTTITIPPKRFASGQTIEQFLIAAQGHSRNPFVGRFVEFDDSEEGVVIWPSIIPLLERFGSEIFHLKLEFDPTVANFEHEILPIFRQMLGLMPNLKTLRVAASRRWTNFEFEEALSYLEENPFPVMEQLQELHEVTRVPSCIINELLKSSCVPQKLKRLSIYNSQEFYEGLHFPNVYWLTLTIRECLDLAWFRMLGCSPRFITVKLDISFASSSRLFHLREILEFLEPLAVMLQKLYLELEVKLLMDGLNKQERPFTFPALKVLTVNELGGVFRFFPTLPTLEYVKVLEDFMLVPFSEYGQENVSPYEGRFVQMDEEDNEGEHENITELTTADSGFWTKLIQLQSVKFPNKIYLRP